MWSRWGMVSVLSGLSLSVLSAAPARAGDVGTTSDGPPMVHWAKAVFTGREQDLGVDYRNATSSEVELSGFGTWGVTHSNTSAADYRGDLRQPNGAGRSSAVMGGLDTKVGVQMVFPVDGHVSLTVQAVADHRSDNTYTPQLEWANLKYSSSDNSWYGRVGRVVAAPFMISDYRNVGYALHMVRPAVDVYVLNNITHVDGGDIGFKAPVGEGLLRFQFSAGRTSERQLSKTRDDPVLVTGTAQVGSIAYDWEHSTYRIGLSRTASIVSSRVTDLYWDAVQQLGPAIGYPPGSMNVRFRDSHTTLLSLGYSYDADAVVAQAEYVAARGNSLLIQDQDAWFVLAGYRVGSFTPYLAYSRIKAMQGAPTNAPACSGASSHLPSCTRFAPLAQFINLIDTRARIVKDNSTISVGLRYDVSKTVDLKIQADYVRKPALSVPNAGVFANYCAPSDILCLAPPWAVEKQSVRLLTATVDFVF